MMRTIRILGLLALAALANCGAPEKTPAQIAAEAAADAAAASVEATVVSHTPVEVYPGAVQVRLKTVDYGRPEGERERDLGPLTLSQRQAIEPTISIVNYGRGVRSEAACFIPHHFLQYYDGAGKKVGEISICFCCAGIRADPVIDAPLPPGAEDSKLTFDYEALKAVFREMGVPTDIECGADEG